jgi:hypothetical protein
MSRVASIQAVVASADALIAGPILNQVWGICVASFHENVERLKSAISRVEMFVNQGGDLQGPQAGSVKAEVVEAWDEFAREFVDASLQADS